MTQLASISGFFLWLPVHQSGSECHVIATVYGGAADDGRAPVLESTRCRVQVKSLQTADDIRICDCTFGSAHAGTPNALAPWALQSTAAISPRCPQLLQVTTVGLLAAGNAYLNIARRVTN